MPCLLRRLCNLRCRPRRYKHACAQSRAGETWKKSYTGGYALHARHPVASLGAVRRCNVCTFACFMHERLACVREEIRLELEYSTRRHRRRRQLRFFVRSRTDLLPRCQFERRHPWSHESRSEEHTSELQSRENLV